MEKLKKEIQFVVDVYKSGDLHKAESTCNKLIRENPKVAFLYNLMGLILMGQKKITKAIEFYEKGIKIDPNFAMIYNNLGLLFFKYKSNGNVKKAEDYYKKSISLNDKISEPHTNLGNLYSSQNKFNEAINSYKKAILINPNFSYAHHNLGNTYIALGDFNEAKKHYEESIKIDPNISVSHRTLSRLIKYTKKDKHFIQLNEIYKNIKSKDTDHKMDISFALGKAYEDMKEFDNSFLFYKEANAIFRKKIDFSLKSETKRFNDIKKIFNKNLFDKYSDSGLKDFSPIFIVGMPRSGTTLVEQIISSHPKVFGADEVNFIPELIQKNFGDNNLDLYFKNVLEFDEKNFKKIGENYIELIKNYSNNSERTTDKLPKNFESLGFIKLILPASKIVHCYRNPMDNCLSIFKNHFPASKIDFAYDLEEIIEYYNLYKSLISHWEKLLPNFIFNIKYENLISNTKDQIDNLLKYCNLPWNEKCMSFHNNKRPIKTASDVQARSKLYKSSINSWKNYYKHLNQYNSKLKVN